MKTAIVTGANGFVGKAVARELAARGIQVTALVRKNAEHLEELQAQENIRIVNCNMDEYAALPTCWVGDAPDVFYHFAWTGSAGILRADDAVQLENIRCTCNAVRTAAALGCKTFVMAGSIMEYEIEAAMRTEQKPMPSTIYCTAKKAADYMARALAGQLGLRYVCGLISNIYGPGETSPRLINTSLRKLLAGEHMAFSTGEQTYDFIYISDAAAAFAEIGEKGKPNKTYYIGSRNPRPLKEFLTQLRDVAVPGASLGLGELPFNGVTLTYTEYDLDAVFKDTGFTPQVCFAEGIRRTAAWIQETREFNV